MSEGSKYFTPPRMAKPIDPVLRLRMELDAETIHVVFCRGFPSLSIYLCFQKDVEVYHVDNAGELRELLDSEDGIPADLVVIYSDDFKDLPPMTVQSPVDGHESTVVFTLDPDTTIEGELDKWYALIDRLRSKKRQFIEQIRLYHKLDKLKEESAL